MEVVVLLLFMALGLNLLAWIFRLSLQVGDVYIYIGFFHSILTSVLVIEYYMYYLLIEAISSYAVVLILLFIISTVYLEM